MMQYRVAISASPQVCGADTHMECWTKGMVLGTCLASSPKSCVTHVLECLSLLLAGFSLIWNGLQSPQIAKSLLMVWDQQWKKNQEGFSSASVYVIAGQQMFSNQLPQMFHFLSGVKGKWEQTEAVTAPRRKRNFTGYVTNPWERKFDNFCCSQIS